jgi:hypothetical protein
VSRAQAFWLSIWGLALIVILTIACLGGGFWAIWEWEKSNYRTYCEARGWEYREAGGRLWCE